jgi:hypothetical protein
MRKRRIKLQSSFPDAQLRIVDAPLGAGPESIRIIVVMDSLMCNCTSKLALRAPRNDGDGYARSICFAITGK